jgi:hypothetical protein
VYTISASNMTEVTCFIMENLLGKDITSIERIFDLKGSTKGRRAKLSLEDLQKPTGLEVLKDLDYIELGENLLLPQEKRTTLFNMI